jgi:hypothetical protein
MSNHKRILPSQVEILCQQEYDRVVETFAGEGNWDDLTQREQLLIAIIANAVVQRILRGDTLPAPLARTREESIAYTAQIVTFFRRKG